MCREPQAAKEKPAFRKSLRNAAINYRNGWFFVTSQVAHNKSIFGAIVGERCELNALGREVEKYWRELPTKYPELELFDFVVMPNHFHAIVRIHYRPTNREHHLGFLMSRFKGGTGYIYGRYRKVGLVEDIGDHLWQFDYWDKLITDERQFAAIAKYIRENPASWSRDRYGAVTSHWLGNLELLNRPRIAFVASQGFFASELRPRRVWGREGGGLKPAAPIQATESGVAPAAPIQAATGSGVAPAAPMQAAAGGNEVTGGGTAAVSARAASAASTPVLISTFTSAQEREALRRALAKGRPVIQAIPQGIPSENELAPELCVALREGRALLISPQPMGSGLNKKVATWCNEYVLRHADEIWVGDLSPNGMLASMLRLLKRF